MVPRDAFIAVYMMSNRKHGTLHIGVTSNLRERAWQHRQGVVNKIRRKSPALKVVITRPPGPREARPEDKLYVRVIHLFLQRKLDRPHEAGDDEQWEPSVGFSPLGRNDEGVVANA